ncbi:MAG: MaoC/PaaZ C-terminal domain-containing protein [Ilumatobacteraceae bacterium]
MLHDWSVIARNLPEHARNPIHTDDGARAAGFPRALVAGVTTYAYLTHPVLAAWGVAWLERGGGEVRFRRPVFEHDVVDCRVEGADDEVMVAAVTSEPEQPRATFTAARDVSSTAVSWTMRAGESLPVHEVVLDGEWGSDYGERAGDDLDLCSRSGLVHPAVWPALANRVVHADVARGSWIHTRSIVRHHALAHAGATAHVHAVVVRRFEAHGERAVLDVRIEVDGRTVASLEHEAIVALP